MKFSYNHLHAIDTNTFFIARGKFNYYLINFSCQNECRIIKNYFSATFNICRDNLFYQSRRIYFK